MADLLPSPSDLAARVDEFMRLYTQHQRRLYIYLLSLVHNVEDAEELLQESSYILWKKFDDFRPDSNFGAWACGVAYFEVLKHREGRKQKEVPLSSQFLERVAAKMAEVSDVLERHGEIFNSCMERLSQPDRELITRRYTVGASVKRIAAELNRPVRSVSKSLARIRRALMECVDRFQRREER
jgi:RNA polymerase sigma-70 factor, ECF subfamily